MFDLLEVLIVGKEVEWFSYFFVDWCYNLYVILGDVFDMYVCVYWCLGVVCGVLVDYCVNVEDV